MGNKESSIKRKLFLINPRFQLTFIGFMTMISFTAILVLYLSDYYFFWKLMKMGNDLGIPTGSVYFKYIDQQRTLMSEITVITSLVLFVFIVISGIVFSHKISGPLYRMDKHMRDIAGGKEFREMKFRKGDFFPEIPEAFNLMFTRLRNLMK